MMKNRLPINIVFRVTFIFLFFLPVHIEAQVSKLSLSQSRWQPGKILYYPDNWVEVIVGDMPLVISVPHGGSLKPDGIPDRDCKITDEGTSVTVTDSRTIELVRAIEAAFMKKYQKRPFIVISNIARTKVDQNRPVDLGTCKDSLAERAWHDFHGSIDTSLALAVQKFGYAMYIDLHGHGHSNQRLELGYSLDGPQLKDAFENEEPVLTYASNSSLQNFLRERNITFKDMLWGASSFGTLMYQYGVPSVPSMQDRFPLPDEKFFSGGYNTRRYTSGEYPKVYGWQIECNYKGVRDSEESRAGFADAFTNAYMKFISLNTSLQKKSK